jgi:hypothetical protein
MAEQLCFAALQQHFAATFYCHGRETVKRSLKKPVYTLKSTGYTLKSTGYTLKSTGYTLKSSGNLQERLAVRHKR